MLFYSFESCCFFFAFFFLHQRSSRVYLQSPELFVVFWPISTMLLLEWSPLILFFPSSPVPVLIFWYLYRVRQLQLVSPSFSCSIVVVFFFQFSRWSSWYLSPFSFFFSFTLWSAETVLITIIIIIIIIIIIFIILTNFSYHH